jgi:hypothetical protein
VVAEITHSTVVERFNRVVDERDRPRLCWDGESLVNRRRVMGVNLLDVLLLGVAGRREPRFDLRGGGP